MSRHSSSADKELLLDGLCEAHEEAGLTQAQDAKAARRSQRWVSKYGLGAECRVDFVELEGFAKALGKPLEWFRTRKG